MRPVSLSGLKAGINRLRTKGNASPSTLYDLLNAWVTQDGGITPREGTTRFATLNNTTKGLCANNGILNVFSTSLVTVPAGFQCNVLVHPTDVTQTLTTIWFAKPFMGFLYVVAQFSNGNVFHYWLQSSGTWTASTVYKKGNIVVPSVLNGLAYQAVRNLPVASTWTPETVVVINQKVEPTAYTGYYYQATAVAGTNPHTSSAEPSWPLVENGTVQEFGDFGVSSTASTTSTTVAAPLSSSITDRYGNSNTIAGNTGTFSGGASTVPVASTVVSTWTSGTLYASGAVVRPSTAQGAFKSAIPNGDFENGNDGNWVFAGGPVLYNSAIQYQGNYCLQISADHQITSATMNTFGVVTPGQSVTASAYFNPHSTTTDMEMFVSLRWYDVSDTFLSQVDGPIEENPGYRKSSVSGAAPANAVHVRVRLTGVSGTSTKQGYVDLVDWSLETPAAVSNFLYEAIQTSPGTSAATEPTWPTVAGNTVIDNNITWKAIGTSIVTWTATPIMKSGTVEPTWPVLVGLSVVDNTMSWVCISRRIADTRDPNTVAVALAASHVFAGNKDLCSYSAAVDPTDWSSANNAGYLPTGLNNYGDNPVTMLTLYRSNLMVFNAGGYQMWQVDPDPANMALLDAQPVGSIYPRAAQSVANDLLFLTEVGVRNLGTVGATANMQVGGLGQPVDSIIRAAIKAGTYAPISLYYPGRGQYWLIFGPQAFVLTVNGQGLKSWSRYVFPASITDWCLNAGNLYLRTSTDLVWYFDDGALQDDMGGTPTNFSGVVQWPYLDSGAIGINKMMVGVDLIGNGAVNVQVAFQESDNTSFSDQPGFSTSPSVTAPYTINMADIVPGTPLPFPINAPSYSLILTFSPNQAWSWNLATLYLTDARGGGSTG